MPEILICWLPAKPKRLSACVQIYGMESSGKTTLAMHCMRECQKKGGMVVMVDLENAWNKSFAKVGCASSCCLSLLGTLQFGDQLQQYVQPEWPALWLTLCQASILALRLAACAFHGLL